MLYDLVTLDAGLSSDLPAQAFIIDKTKQQLKFLESNASDICK